MKRWRPARRRHTQEAKLSEQLARKTGLAITSADVFFVPAAQGGTSAGSLAFRAESDGGGDYSYPHVGFYAEPALTTKLSRARDLQGLPGVIREQVDIRAGSTYYAADSDGSVHALSVVSSESGTVFVQVTHVEAP